MSERRSTEIKFRTTPSFKARVQAAAAAADKSMSEYIEECVEMRLWAAHNAEFPATAVPFALDAVSTSGEDGAKEELPALTKAQQEHQFEVLLNPFAESTQEPKGWMFKARQ